MDYVLFGMGYGATLMLLGWALRTFGPERKYKNVNPEDIELSVAQRRWVRFIQGLGGVIAIAGTALVLFTFVIMLVNPDDDTGSFISLVIWGFLALAVLIWCWFYFSSYGITGIWSRQDGYGFRGTSSAPARTPGMQGLSTARVVPAPRVSRPDTDPTDGQFESTAQDVPSQDVDDVPPDATASDDPQYSPPEESNVETPEEEMDSQEPEYDFGDSADTTVPKEVGGRSEAIRRLRERRSRASNSTDSR